MLPLSHRQTSLTAGTLFESTKLPLTLWFQGLYLMTQHKKGISAMALHRQLGISYNAAWRMKHKLMQAMMERDHEKKLSGFIELDDAYPWAASARDASRAVVLRAKHPLLPRLRPLLKVARQGLSARS